MAELDSLSGPKKLLASEVRDRPPSSALVRLGASALDVLVATNLLGLILALAGGADLGFVSWRHPSKPILLLIVLIPLRVAVGGGSLIVDWARQAIRSLVRERPLARIRIPAAVVDTAFALVIARGASLFVAFLGNLLLEPSRTRGFALPFTRQKFAEVFAAWDSSWYFDIASRGYYFRSDGQSSIAFFPLYPMLMRALAAPFGGSDSAIWVAGIVISYAAFALALFALHRLTEQLLGDRDIARRTVLYVALFPFSLFMTRVYAESLFLLMTVLAIGRAVEGRWWRAGLWGALATLARPNGILIGLPLVLLAARGSPPLRTLAWRLVAMMPVPAALAGYSVYVYTLSGDPIAWMSAQAQWGYSIGHPPWQQLLKMVTRLVEYGFYDYFFVSEMAPFRLLHGIPALIFLALTPAIFKQLGMAMGVYVLASLLVPLSSNALEGVGRYASVLFPAFMVVGTIASPRAHEAILIVASFFLALFVCLFVTLQPIY